MKKCIISLLFAVISLVAHAQSVEILHEEIERLGEEVQIDSTLQGRDIFSILPGNVVVQQSEAVRNALYSRILSNSSAIFNGFRVRIFLDSRLGSREESLAAIRRFNSMYPGVIALRSYSAPNFKVTVGNFRTKLDAERFLKEIQADFPEAFVVRDKFRYPTIGKSAERVYPDYEIEL